MVDSIAFSGDAPERPRLVPALEWGRRHGVESKVDEAMRLGQLAYYRLGSRWRYLDEAEAEAWLDSHRVVDPRSERPAYNPTPWTSAETDR